MPDPSYLILLIFRLFDKLESAGFPSGPKTCENLLKLSRLSISYETSISGICSLKTFETIRMGIPISESAGKLYSDLSIS